MALAFLALITQFGAFWLWYRALATGVSRTSQLQLLQPFLTLLLAAALLGESIPAELWLYAAAVVITVHLARNRGLRTRQPTEETTL
jgi:drug/metabolite transporter (DMT)-like permease